MWGGEFCVECIWQHLLEGVQHWLTIACEHGSRNDEEIGIGEVLLQCNMSCS
jgi:hypothetical protein